MELLLKQIEAIIKDNLAISKGEQSIRIWVEDNRLYTESVVKTGATISTKSEILTDIEVKQRLYKIKEDVLAINHRLRHIKQQVDEVQ